MSELKAYQVEKFIAEKPTRSGVYLVYGPDSGLVHERGSQLCAAPINTSDSQFSETIVSLQMDELDADPSKLAVEALTQSMFGGKPVIRVRNASKALEPVLIELLAKNADAFIVIEAGNLTKHDKMRLTIEGAKNGWTLPCFADDQKSLHALITEVFQQEKIEIDRQSIAYLSSILGNDREITRRELEKLCNFAAIDKTLTLQDVQTLCGNNSALALDSLVDALGLGQTQKLETALNKAYDSGLDSQLLLNASARHFQFLRTVRLKMDAGSNSNSALSSTYPRPHFSRKQAIDQQINRWSSQMSIAKAAKRIFDATLQSRRSASLSEAITRRALLGICIAARAK